MSSRGPLYRIGAPIPIVPRTRCDECQKPAHALWLTEGRSLCSECRRKQPTPNVDLTQPARLRDGRHAGDAATVRGDACDVMDVAVSR